MDSKAEVSHQPRLEHMDREGVVVHTWVQAVAAPLPMGMAWVSRQRPKLLGLSGGAHLEIHRQMDENTMRLRAVHLALLG
jgi:hypothetical protein